MNKYYKNIIIGVIVFVAMFLIIGASYAFFTARIVGNEDAELMKLDSGTIELTFVDNNTINLSNSKPGDSESKTFTVQNTGTLDDDYTYNIKLVDVETSFLKRDLKYTLEECNDIECTTLKENGLKEEGYIATDIVKNGEMYLAVDIPRPEKQQFHYYKLTIEFKNLENENQNYNQGAIFNGKINVDAEEGMKLYEQEPNAPELYQGLIPVIVDSDGKIYVANLKEEWYDYDDHRWANAVLVDASNEEIKNKYFNEDGSLKDIESKPEIPMNEILQMYVWIPRYKYKLFNVNNVDVPEQEIKIQFEYNTESTGNVTCKYTQTSSTINENCTKKDGTAAANNDWYTHPAFTFKGTLEESGTELTGIWVGKFESSGANNSNQITDLKILPNVSSLRSVAVAYMFQGVRDLEEKHSATYNINPLEIDTHMMKNMEWGAVAYLTQSKYGRFNSDGSTVSSGAEVWKNNDQNYTTGCAGSSVSASLTICTDDFKWTKGGVHASTTNNVSGVYDMSGGSWEYVMGNMVNESGDFYSSDASFAASSDVIVPNPAAKYYDVYAYGTDYTDATRGHLGDATRETRNWYSDYAYFPQSSGSWSVRGGENISATEAGVWFSSADNGGARSTYSFRVVLTQQD